MRQPHPSVAAAFAIALLLGVGTSAAAADQPISGAKLQLKISSGGKRQLLFVSKDPNFLFPAIGDVDDPQLDGALIDVVPQPNLGGSPAFTLPAGMGKPGWRAKTGPHPYYRFDNAQAPDGISAVRLALLKQGKQIKILIGTFPFSLDNFFDGFAIRIRTGNQQSCVMFGPETIVRHDARGLLAMNASATALSDCSDASIGLGCAASSWPACGGPCPLGGVCGPTFGSSCKCVSPNAPCGGTAPVCNGTCAVGEECAAVGPGYPSCVCIPAGATPCGSPSAPVCGGACSPDTVCRPIYGSSYFGSPLGCGCAPSGACGGPEHGNDCGAGSACGYVASFPPPGGNHCLPMLCGGTYPTCGGICGDGGACAAVNIPNGPVTYCACAAPAPCDSSCGGLACPGAQVCTVTTGSPNSCGCQ